MNCLKHEAVMIYKPTQFGLRYSCPVVGCDVVCWDGSTSTPADTQTRALRHKCHEAFDPLWQTKRRFKTRPDAYRWLCSTMYHGQGRINADLETET